MEQVQSTDKMCVNLIERDIFIYNVENIDELSETNAITIDRKNKVVHIINIQYIRIEENGDMFVTHKYGYFRVRQKTGAR